jgi:HEAT repeat protein
MTDSARIAERMIAMARDRNLPAALRTSAMRWLRGPAEREGRAAAADRALRDVAGDASEPTELREQALRRLGESRADGNASWLREMVLDRAQSLVIRERALRVLGEELDRPDLVRQLYPQLDHVTLEERAVRVVGERRGADAADWLRQTAEDRDGHEAVRERAIRVLGERGEMAYLRALYPRLDRMGLRERVIRVAAESGRNDAHEWLERIVLDGGEQQPLRERAVRELAERGVATTELVRLYDRADNLEVRARLIRIFAERGDRAAMDKLAAIVRDDTHPSLRRDAQRRLAERTR